MNGCYCRKRPRRWCAFHEMELWIWERVALALIDGRPIWRL